MLGLGFAFLREMTDRRIREADDLSDILQTRVLSVLPKQQAASRPSRFSFGKRKKPMLHPIVSTQVGGR
jgi:hypothetical protein